MVADPDEAWKASLEEIKSRFMDYECDCEKIEHQIRHAFAKKLYPNIPYPEEVLYEADLMINTGCLRCCDNEWIRYEERIDYELGFHTLKEIGELYEKARDNFDIQSGRSIFSHGGE